MVLFSHFIKTNRCVNDENDPVESLHNHERQPLISTTAVIYGLGITKPLKRFGLLGAVFFCTFHLLQTNQSTTFTSFGRNINSAYQNDVFIQGNLQDNFYYLSSWRNIHYYSGVFKEPFSPHDELIREVCEKQIGIIVPNVNQINDTCAGPIKTNTTCCYCYISHKADPFNYTPMGYKHWICAAPRDYSIQKMAPTNEKHVDIKGSKVALVAAKIAHNGTFRDEVEEYCGAIKSIGVIQPQHVFCYWDSPDFVLHNKKFKRHLRFHTDPDDTSAKGGGYWFHKSVLLRHHLNYYKDSDFLVWTDVDRVDLVQNPTIAAMLEAMAHQGGDLSVEVMGFTSEQEYTKEDMLAAFNASTVMRASPQVSANLVVFRNSPTMRRFMDAWIECVTDWHMVSDEPSVMPNSPIFDDHRHDQSILGLLIKSHMTTQGVVGPPARTYHSLAEVVTYRFNSDADPVCPFSSYYAAMFAARMNKTVD